MDEDHVICERRKMGNHDVDGMSGNSKRERERNDSCVFWMRGKEWGILEETERENIRTGG